MNLKVKIISIIGVTAGNKNFVHSVWLNEKMPTSVAVNMINSWKYVWSTFVYRLRHMIGKGFYQ